MEKTGMPLWFIAWMSAIFLLKTPGGLGDISNGITPDFLWFFIPAITSQFISYSVRLVRMAVGPETWKKMEEHAIERKVMVVCVCLEMLTIHKMLVLVFIDGSFWEKFIARWLTIGTIAFMSACVLIMHFLDGKKNTSERVTGGSGC